MNIYMEGGIVMMGVYAITRFLGKYIPKRFIGLIPILVTPAMGAAYAAVTHGDIVATLVAGFGVGAGAMATHETIDHVVLGK